MCYVYCKLFLIWSRCNVCVCVKSCNYTPCNFITLGDYPLLIYSNGNVILYSKCQQVKSGNLKICHTVVSSAQANNFYTCMFAHLNLKHVHRKLLRSLVEAWIRYISYFPTRKILGRVRMKSASMMSIFSCKRAIRYMADLQHKASRCWLIEKLKRLCVSLAAC